MADIFCWNIRGFNDRVKRRSFKKWFRHNKPIFGSLIETRVKSHKSLKYVQSTFPGWNFADNYEFAELGRIWVVWDPKVKLAIFSKSSQMVTCVISLPHSLTEMVVSFVYAVNCKNGRQELWEELTRLALDPTISHKPWAVMGDFNQILHPMEKSNGGTRITQGMAQFRDCVYQAGLFDIASRGKVYTWWNNQELNPIAKKLDRILINDHWQLARPYAYGFFGDLDASDHCPATIVLGEGNKSKRPFMISHFLLQHEEFLPRVAHHWQHLNMAGSSMFVLSRKLKSLKGILRDLNREHFSGLETRVQEAHATLLECQNALLINPSTQLAEQEKVAHRAWLKLAGAEENFLMQRSRVQWIQSGDCNSSFFHRAIAARRGTNQIHYLLDSSDARLDFLEDIQSHTVNYFSDLFGGESTILSQEDIHLINALTPFNCSVSSCQLLQKLPTPEEIRKEVFALPLNKSPGPDGYSGEFFRKAWGIVGEDFIAAVLECFTTGKMLKQWNCTAITLVPKKTGVERLCDYRPISCCNAVYKVVSKLLARRLESLLPEMISNTQSAFVKGRLLVENVLLASELVQGFTRKHTTPRGLLQVDLRKAFDSVSWGFIIQVLKSANFPPIYINWVKNCITTTSFSVTVNGDLCGFFKGGRGLRQGCPLSPFLFVMAMEVLGEMLQRRFQSGNIGMHPLGHNPLITHLAFADDILIFFDGAASSLQGISETLQDFQLLSGLGMNRNKTTLFYAGLNLQESESLTDFGFRHGSMPFRYLGLPLLHKKLRKADYSPLIDKITARIQHWTIKTLSFAGRLQLITSVIYALVNFWLSAFALPKGCLKEIQSLCTKFLWAGNLEKQTTAKVSWKDMCLPKSEGGLGLRDFVSWNKVLTLRLFWLLISGSSSLWVAWNREHRLKRTNIWAVEIQPNSSWIWKFIMALRPLAKGLISCDIGDGNQASFWHDNWTNHGPLLDYLGLSGPTKLGIPISATVAQAATPPGWRLPSARSRSQEILQLRNTLIASPLPLATNGPDHFKWGPPASRSSFFSIKKAWETLRPAATPVPWTKVVWFKGCIPKQSFMFWTANLDRLPVRSRLVNWGMNISPLCCMCNLHTETRDHLFLQCEVAEHLWHMVLRRLGHPTILFHNWSTLITWLSSVSYGISSKLKLIASHAIVYHLWRERNSRHFNSSSVPPATIFALLDRGIKDLLLARRTRKGWTRLLSKWFAYS
ncbi:putative ribonuclease H protein [Cardamine amara subsp. amara]|uniref:Ribonuclease H protein n=1 Tax=Cardamine amara subsp. amara TaxID=228776 RepID=A0ABD0ZVQ0_CARAN